MKKLRKDYKFALAIFYIGVLSLIGCHSNKIRHEAPLVKYIDDAFIKTLDCSVEKHLSNGDYVLSYEIEGFFVKDNLYTPLKLRKVYLLESLNEEDGVYIKTVRISPVKGVFLGKAPRDSILSFHFKNEYLLKKRESDSINMIRFLSGDKEQIIELWQTK